MEKELIEKEKLKNKLKELEMLENECMQNLKKTIIENKQKYETFKDHLNSSIDCVLKVDNKDTNQSKEVF